MYKTHINTKTSLKVNQSEEGETIEQKVHRIVNNKEPITDGAPLIYTERGEGIKPEYDIRTDKMDMALDVMDKIHRTDLAKRQERIDAWREAQKTPEQKAADQAAKNQNNNGGKQNDGGAESVQGTK